MNHTRTLLKSTADATAAPNEIRSVEGGRLIAQAWAIMAGISEAEAAANARRLVACWNACEKAGLTNEQLDRGFMVVPA